jgi:predicted DNA-binding protein with PD1-like motif
MQTLVDGDAIVVVLSPGEEILESLVEAARAHDIRGGFLTGLGSTSEVELAFFDPEKKEYVPRSFNEPMEIGSMAGNFSRLDDEYHVHIHATVCGPELIAFTGHLNRGVVGTACEIYIRRTATEIVRVKDPDAGFNPLKLK